MKKAQVTVGDVMRHSRRRRMTEFTRSRSLRVDLVRPQSEGRTMPLDLVGFRNRPIPAAQEFPIKQTFIPHLEG